MDDRLDRLVAFLKAFGYGHNVRREEGPPPRLYHEFSWDGPADFVLQFSRAGVPYYHSRLQKERNPLVFRREHETDGLKTAVCAHLGRQWVQVWGDEGTTVPHPWPYYESESPEAAALLGEVWRGKLPLSVLLDWFCDHPELTKELPF